MCRFDSRVVDRGNKLSHRYDSYNTRRCRRSLDRWPYLRLVTQPQTLGWRLSASGPAALQAIQSHGLALLGAGVIVTLVPLIAGTLFAHRILRINPVIVCGALAGAMTVDAAVSAACEVAKSQTPVLGVAVPYAIANVVLTMLGPIIIGLTFTT